jgi:alpha-tubulin suppressor-like RCC1 family protein
VLGVLAVAPGAQAAKAVSAGWMHTCAVTETGGAMCWGANEVGQLGDGTTSDRYTPTPVSGLSSGVTAITAGKGDTCAVTRAGEAECWGENGYGQLGDGTMTGSHIPVPVSGLSSGVTAIAAAEYHTCALTQVGAVFCWGQNIYGQLGDGTTTSSTIPVPVSGLSSGVTAIAAGGNHTCALTRTGGVMCWGGNATGALGDGTTTERTTPVPVSGLSSGVTAIAAGLGHTCARTQAGAALCWGLNAYAELGDGTTTTRLTPVPVSGLSSGVTAIEGGAVDSCAVTAAGGAGCWGYNAYVEVGDGTTTTRLTPVPVSGLSSGVTAIAGGGYHTCAIAQAGVVFCWGENSRGQLGDGTTTDHTTPAPVARITQTITFPALADHSLGEPDFPPGATASSGLAVTYASQTPAVCTIVSGEVHLLAIGGCTLTAEQGGDGEFDPAGPVRRSFAVAAPLPAPPTPPAPPANPTPTEDGTNPAGATLLVQVGPAPRPAVPAPKVVLHRSGKGKSARWSFVLTDTARGVKYRCRLDKAPFRPCSSPKVYRHLRRGTHTFVVKATDAAGAASSPTKVRFRVVGAVQ